MCVSERREFYYETARRVNTFLARHGQSRERAG